MDPHPADTSLPGTILNRIGRRLLFTVGVNTVVALFLLWYANKAQARSWLS